MQLLQKDDTAGKKGYDAGWYAATPDPTNGGKPDATSYEELAKKEGEFSVGNQTLTKKTINDVNTDGIDDDDSSLITIEKAYELASKELLAANQIGDTEGSAKVENLNAAKSRWFI